MMLLKREPRPASAPVGPRAQRRREWLVVLAIFALSTLIRFILGDFPKRIKVYPDELRYFMMAENIGMGRGLQIHNLPTDFQKILYSLCLAPIFAVTGNKWTQMHLIALFNAAAMSSGVFPVYLLSRDLVRDRKRIFALCALYALISDMTYSMTLMSEVTFLPLGLWCVLGVYRLIVYEGSAAKRRLLSVLLGIALYMLYLNKEIALAFLIAYAMYAFTVLAFKKLNGESAPEFRAELRAQLLQMALVFGSFLAAFLVMKRVLFAGYGNSYNQTSLGVLFQKGHARYMLYGVAYYVVSAVVGFGFFPVIYPAIFPQRCEKKAKKLYLFLLYLLLVTAVTISYTITIREDFERGAVPRTHLRYICQLFMPFMIVFFHQTQNGERMTAKEVVRALLWMGGIVYFIGCFWPGPQGDGSVDHTLLRYLCNISQDRVLLAMMGWGILLLMGVLLFNRRPAAVLCAYIAVIGGGTALQ